MNDPVFTHDVFLSHSAKDKAVVRVPSLSASNGERAGVRCRSLHLVRQEGPFNFGTRTSDFGLPRLCMSANAFGSDWAQLEAGTFRFRDPLNQERRFTPKLRPSTFAPRTSLDAPIKGSLAPSGRQAGQTKSAFDKRFPVSFNAPKLCE